MNLGLIEVDETRITLANQSFSDISGYYEELIGQKASELLVSKESENEISSQNSNRQKVLHSYELKSLIKNGEKGIISGAPNYNLHGKVIGSIGIHLDVTEQKLLEERLYLLSLIAEKNINAVVVSNYQGQVEWANKSFVEMSATQWRNRKKARFVFCKGQRLILKLLLT
jgi:PAS domain S-box-containing protein